MILSRPMRTPQSRGPSLDLAPCRLVVLIRRVSGQFPEEDGQREVEWAYHPPCAGTCERGTQALCASTMSSTTWGGLVRPLLG